MREMSASRTPTASTHGPVGTRRLSRAEARAFVRGFISGLAELSGREGLSKVCASKGINPGWASRWMAADRYDHARVMKHPR